MDTSEMKRLNSFASLAVMVIITVFIAWLIISLASWMQPYDDTDLPGGRSGMDLLTDHRTGCQYLYRRGAITPRMDANGKQICGVNT